MPTLKITDEQVVELIEQLPVSQQEALFQRLAARRWASWVELSRSVQDRIREVARKHGREWDAINEDEREAFVDELVHEDR